LLAVLLEVVAQVAVAVLAVIAQAYLEKVPVVARLRKLP